MTEKRLEKFERVVAQRQPNMTVILENVHDIHNIGAVLRTADSVGIREIFVCNTEAHLQKEEIFLTDRVSRGARKWVNVNFYHAIEPCFKAVKSRYDEVWATHLAENAKGLYELDLTGSIALLFGNEHDGLSQEALAHATGNFLIPQMGMTESLNISVACAVTLYEGLRQRKEAKMYANNPLMPPSKCEKLMDEYQEIHGLHKDLLGHFKKLE